MTLNRRSVLSATADAAIVLLALAVATQVALQIRDRLKPVRQPPAARATAPQPSEFVPGDKLPQDAGVNLAQADYTLLMFLSSRCGYCTASMPFYNRLSKARADSVASIQLAALSAEPHEVLERYLAEHAVTLDAAVGLSPGQFRDMRVRGTPTLILATRDGIVRNVWRGRLAEDQEAEVLAAVEGRLATQ